MKQLSTEHKIYFAASQNMTAITDESVNMVVTSPPYPMIAMWDEIFAKQNTNISNALSTNPLEAFELMHQELDKVWRECFRVIKDGGFLCINIGDATRTIDSNFQLYNNHSRIIQACLEIGFTNLPNIIWRKQTNAPNKFMGSGMLPCGAYVTLEHEWILIFRKGGKRPYKVENEKIKRRSSSFFWEERNTWFSDIWDVKGIKQKIKNSETRERSAAFPLEIPYRLINMYSQQGDVILDPFMGMGTTAVAAMLSERNSIGYEIDEGMKNCIKNTIQSYAISEMNQIILNRYTKHFEFIASRKSEGKEIKHYNEVLSCSVMTSQETDISLHYIKQVLSQESRGVNYSVEYFNEINTNQIPHDNSMLF